MARRDTNNQQGAALHILHQQMIADRFDPRPDSDVYLIDDEGNYLVDDEGKYLISKES